MRIDPRKYNPEELKAKNEVRIKKLTRVAALLFAFASVFSFFFKLLYF